MSTFFNNFPRVDLKVGNNTFQYHDIFRFVNIQDDINTDPRQYRIVRIQDGERPDNLSQRLYKNSNFYWTFFIVNDRLMNGTDEWPKSLQELDRSIQDEYRGLGVIALEPMSIGAPASLLEKFDDIFGANLGVPLLNGIDLSYEGLRIRRSIRPNSQAKIVEYDSTKGQLWVTDPQDPFFYARHDDMFFEIFLTSGDHSEWLLKTQTEWYEPLYGSYGGVDFQADLEALLVFNAREYYENGYIAPHHFRNDLGDIIPWTDHTIVNGGGFPVPNVEVRREENDAKSEIRVLKREYIYSFADKYNYLLKKSSRLRI